uniref:Rho GTPase activating protein 27 n=1 Tax=Poecilia latipinna TaxID=48699 RepID=A0A3B3UK25_9TELE
LKWIKSVDDQGQTYYYLRDGTKSEWNLPEVKTLLYFTDFSDKLKHRLLHLIFAQTSNVYKPNLQNNEILAFLIQFQVQNLEKAGILNKTKIIENGKKNKTNQIVPEFTVELKGATIGWATKDKSSKKNVLELKGKNGVEFLIQYDTESIIHDWHKILKDTIQQKRKEKKTVHTKLLGIFIVAKQKKKQKQKNSYKHTLPSISQSPNNAGETDPKKVRTKLMKFLMKRPTLQSVKEKGYIRENVFGCHLHTLCAHERTTVPSFVDKCIKAVERRGLDIDGLYRVSGNLAVIQKLRFKADHGEELDLEDGQWEDVHVITGALKLFFRELPEPLFPFSHFNEFKYNLFKLQFTQTHCFVSLSLSLSLNDRVIEYGEDNRMTVQNVAIVFGPTLLRPETETANITMHMVFQNQIVEFILNEYSRLFYSS